MGEYFKLYNKTKHQSIHPHRVGNGLKLGEWLYPTSDVLASLQALINVGTWSPDDEYFAVSDCGSVYALNGNPCAKIEMRTADELYCNAPEVMPPEINVRGSGWSDADWPKGKPVFDRAILPHAPAVFAGEYPGEEWDE